MSIAVIVQVVFTTTASPNVLKWVNNENPKGKCLKGLHLVLSVVMMVLICNYPCWYQYDPILSVFTAGLFMPREERISKWIPNKINHMLMNVFYPVFFVWVGLMANLSKFDPQWMTWARIFCL